MADSAESAVVAASSPERPQKPSKVMKELMRLQKKLREVVKIEEQLAAGREVDCLQRPKVARKGELLAQVAEAERHVEAEQRAAEEREQQAQQEEQRRAAAAQEHQQRRQRDTAASGPQEYPHGQHQMLPVHAAVLPAQLHQAHPRPPTVQENRGTSGAAARRRGRRVAKSHKMQATGTEFLPVSNGARQRSRALCWRCRLQQTAAASCNRRSTWAAGRSL